MDMDNELTWEELQHIAADRDDWKKHVTSMRAKARGKEWSDSNVRVKQTRQETKEPKTTTTTMKSIYRHHLKHTVTHAPETINDTAAAAPPQATNVNPSRTQDPNKQTCAVFSRRSLTQESSITSQQSDTTATAAARQTTNRQQPCPRQLQQ